MRDLPAVVEDRCLHLAIVEGGLGFELVQHCQMRCGLLREVGLLALVVERALLDDWLQLFFLHELLDALQGHRKLMFSVIGEVDVLVH